jgi:hypothetical protein
MPRAVVNAAVISDKGFSTDVMISGRPGARAKWLRKLTHQPDGSHTATS